MPATDPAASPPAPATITAFRAAADRGDADAVAALLAPDVALHSPLTDRVRAAARAAHRALGCRHYSLFDFRIDPQGNPWFLEAGLYCSFAPSSVIAVMAAGTGTGVGALFAGVLTELDQEAKTCTPSH